MRNYHLEDKQLSSLEEEDYHYLKSFFSRRRDRIDARNQQRLIDIFNYVFGKNEMIPTGCLTCSHTGFLKNVNKLHKYFMEAEELINKED